MCQEKEGKCSHFFLLDKGIIPRVLMCQRREKGIHFFPMDIGTVARVFMCLKKGGGRLSLSIRQRDSPQVLMYQEKGGKCSHFFPLDNRTVTDEFLCARRREEGSHTFN
jgi:hypothetical protein